MCPDALSLFDVVMSRKILPGFRLQDLWDLALLLSFEENYPCLQLMHVAFFSSSHEDTEKHSVRIHHNWNIVFQKYLSSCAHDHEHASVLSCRKVFCYWRVSFPPFFSSSPSGSSNTTSSLVLQDLNLLAPSNRSLYLRLSTILGWCLDQA